MLLKKEKHGRVKTRGYRLGSTNDNLTGNTADPHLGCVYTTWAALTNLTKGLLRENFLKCFVSRHFTVFAFIAVLLFLLCVCLFVIMKFLNILTYFMQTCKVVSYIFPNIEALFEVPISVR